MTSGEKNCKICGSTDGTVLWRKKCDNPLIPQTYGDWGDWHQKDSMSAKTTCAQAGCIPCADPHHSTLSCNDCNRALRDCICLKREAEKPDGSPCHHLQPEQKEAEPLCSHGKSAFAHHAAGEFIHRDGSHCKPIAQEAEQPGFVAMTAKIDELKRHAFAWQGTAAGKALSDALQIIEKRGEALAAMIESEVDYMRRNHLGDPEKLERIIAARQALSEGGKPQE